MELFDGIAILATNLRANLDEAFTRRLDSLVDFPEPEAEYRRRLWERSLGSDMPRAADLDLDFLAESFKLSGGAIRNIAVAAAYAAAEAKHPLDMGDLVRATHQQITKEWWHGPRHSYDIYISQAVLDEAAGGDAVAASERAREGRYTRL